MYDDSDVDRLQQLQDSAERLAYSADWHPTECGDSLMRISSDGRWWHQGTLINKAALVLLFSRLLRREGQQYFLITPVEKLAIVVDDAPFVSIVTQVRGEGEQQCVYVTTNLGDSVLIGPEYPLTLALNPQAQQMLPYVSIGAGLAVRLQRSDFYHLVEHSEERVLDGRSVIAVRSQGHWYSLGVLD